MYIKLSKIKCSEIINKFNDGINKRELSKEYCVSYGTISNIIDRNGRERIIPNKKYKVNKNYFKNIDTEEKSYWLGFMYADGYIIEKKSSFYTGLLIKDYEHIEKFKKTIDSNHPIKCATIENNYVLCIYNKEFSLNLMKHGVVPRKTKIITFPDIQDKFVSHFIRGFFDGDGCITCTEKTLAFNLCCASERFLISIIEELKKKISFNRNMKIYKRKDGLFYIVNNSVIDIEKIYQYFYIDSNIFLERKKIIFDFIIKNKNVVEKIINKYAYERKSKK